MSAELRIEKLERRHAVESFDCGKEALNRFLVRQALQNEAAGPSRTYVAVSGGEIIGYYSLAAAQATYEDAADRLNKGLAQHPTPVIVLARLAVASSRQGERVGMGLLKDAILRTLQAAEIAGIRALAVHAKDDAARAFYERFDFAPSPTDPYHLYVLLKDLRAEIG